MTDQRRRSEDSVSRTAERALRVLEDADEALSERDLFIRLRPVDRVGLHRALRELRDTRAVVVREVGTLPGPIVTTYEARA